MYRDSGYLGGLLKKLNNSRIDIGVIPLYTDKYIAERVDISYPYNLEDYTFFTRKAVYKPHIFAIFRTFSLSVWLTIILILFIIPILSYTIQKRKYKSKNIFFWRFCNFDEAKISYKTFEACGEILLSIRGFQEP